MSNFLARLLLFNPLVAAGMQAFRSLPDVRVLKGNLCEHACRTILQVQNNPM